MTSRLSATRRKTLCRRHESYLACVSRGSAGLLRALKIESWTSVNWIIGFGIIEAGGAPSSSSEVAHAGGSEVDGSRCRRAS